MINYILAKYYGIKEVLNGNPSNTITTWVKKYFPKGGVDIPYCSIALKEVAAELGYENSKLTPAAISWLNLPDKVDLKDAILGDIVILKRVGGNHVGLLVRHSAIQNIVYILGFNQGNECNITPYNVKLIRGIRRCPVIV